MNERMTQLFCRIGGKDEPLNRVDVSEKPASGRRAEKALYENSRIRATLTWEPVGEGRTRLACSWQNRTQEKLSCQLEIRIRTDFVYEHYVIPGVSLNGNDWGKGKEPKGLASGGEPWVFDYRRTTIPACTISENGDRYFALMASDESPLSMQASCSMLPQEDGTMVHRLLYPCIERPETYCRRDCYEPSHEDFLTFDPQEAKETAAWLLAGRPVRPNFATACVEDAALELLGSPFPSAYGTDEVKRLCCAFAERLVVETNGRKMFSIGQTPDGKGGFQNAEGYEFGWCGQNGMYARLFLERGLRTGDQKLICTALDNLDAWTHEAVEETGLIHTHYHWMLNGESDVEDTCNLGFAVLELTRAWSVMRKNGEDRPEWLEAARRIADFLISHWADEHGFGKAWNVKTGECADPAGTIGAYLIPGLVELYLADGRERWLEAARRACRFYRDRDLFSFQCTAGALDTYCIDKESSGPLLAGALALYEIDKAEEWLECAKLAGWYFCSWMFHHDIIPGENSDFARYGYRTLGGTSVSAQHHHIDPWGALMVPQLLRLWKITGDWHWHRRASLMWANAVQNLAPSQGKTIHGLFREAGAQNEGYHHCCWGDPGAPGFINDWLVAWPQAFCWNTAEQITDADLADPAQKSHKGSDIVKPSETFQKNDTE
ncbi:MAG TPA: hypothetical protein H9761_10805 [Candidatus Eisenbergiella merdavium]|uniref:Uncharacterized protein n=1 Tax=Candidatus Eisenbergiella merdavium TaxID=2838551 RepID=A0A9D2SRH1_9FIRM|nr:hypothetical protein [Candidatus Eisenbergiella merdavium]